jgi:hypothetical protein
LAAGDFDDVLSGQLVVIEPIPCSSQLVNVRDEFSSERNLVVVNLPFAFDVLQQSTVGASF